MHPTNHKRRSCMSGPRIFPMKWIKTCFGSTMSKGCFSPVIAIHYSERFEVDEICEALANAHPRRLFHATRNVRSNRFRKATNKSRFYTYSFSPSNSFEMTKMQKINLFQSRPLPSLGLATFAFFFDNFKPLFEKILDPPLIMDMAV